MVDPYENRAKVGGVIGQNHVYVVPTGIGRKVSDGHVGQVQLDVAATTRGSDVKRNRGVDVYLPFPATIASISRLV